MLQSPLASAHSISLRTAELIRPRRKLTPAVAAAEYLRNEKGAWSAELTPEMVEPLNLLSGRDYTGIVFVGPARSGKTFGLILAGAAYVITCAPGDTLIVSTSQDSARDFSRMDLDRCVRHSPEIQQRISPRARDDNTFDKFFRSGIVLKLGWPAVTQLSSKTLRYVLISDYDRPENRDNVDGEGPLYDLAAKRVETYMSRGKVLAESSPGGDYIDAQWRASTPHEAPPALGILSLYNRGTRGRLYWPCLKCGEFSQAEPGIGNFRLLPAFDELLTLVLERDLMSLADQYARVICKACAHAHQLADRTAMKARARWLHEGERIDRRGEVSGTRLRTQIASYWLGGVAAAYQRWDSLILKYLQAIRTYALTRDEGPLRATCNTDQAAAYLPRAIANRRAVEQLIERARHEEGLTRGVVPIGVRFLTAAIDVQAHRFCVLIMGWGVQLESWIVDRYDISASARPEGDRTAAIDPAAYLEDWDVLREGVITKTWPVEGNPDAAMTPLLVFCDSGGREGVTERAYEFWRQCKRAGLGRKFRLVKGARELNAPRTRESWPDSRHKTSGRLGRGDVPVCMLGTHTLKDGVACDLARAEPGPGYVHLPAWLPANYFDELTVETRTEKGWTKPPGSRNEAFDLHVYSRAAVIRLGAEKINWQSPPPWARGPQGVSESSATRPRAADSSLSTVVGDEPEISESEPMPPARTPARAYQRRKGSWVQGWK